MNARKALLILGGVILAFIIALVAVALFTIQKMETEKNVKQTEKARRVAEQNRKAKAEQPSNEVETKENEEDFKTLEQLGDVQQIEEVI